MKRDNGPLYISPLDSNYQAMSWDPVQNIYYSEETGELFDPDIMQFIEEEIIEEPEEDLFLQEEWDYAENCIEDEEDFMLQMMILEEEQRIQEEEYQRQQNFLYAMILLDEGEFD